MQLKKLFFQDTDVDFRSASSLYVIFAVVITVLGFASRSMGMNFEIAGASVVKHVSDIMTEHEAPKTIVALFLVVIFLGYIRTGVASVGKKIPDKLDRYLFLPPSTFLVELVAVVLAVATAVLLSAPKGMGYGFLVFYVGGKTALLAGTLFLTVSLLFQSPAVRFRWFYNLVVPSLCVALHFLTLACTWPYPCSNGAG